MVYKKNISGSRLRLLLLAFFDLLLMSLSLFLALLLRNLAVPEYSYVFTSLLAFAPVFLMWMAIFYANGLYALDAGINALAFMRSLSQSLILALVSAVFFFYISRGAQYAPKTILLLCILVLGVLEGSLRLSLMRMMAGRIKRRVAILASGPDRDSLVAKLRSSGHGAYRLEALLTPNAEGLKDLLALVSDGKLDDIVLSTGLHGEQLATGNLFELLKNPVDFHYFSDFFELNMRKLPLADISDFWVLESLGNSRGRRYDRIKHLLDIFVAALLLIVLLPVLGLVAAVVKAGSPGPVLFRQQRCGLYNRLFTIYKFRTMKITDNDGAPTLVDDSRITPGGKILRKTRLDELPQLWNVLKGDMSLIGPRPERPELAVHLDAAVPFYRQRLLVRPGISGWDQVSGEYHSASVEDTCKKLQSDLYYIKNRSLWLDFKILLKTIATILSRAGI